MHYLCGCWTCPGGRGTAYHTVWTGDSNTPGAVDITCVVVERALGAGVLRIILCGLEAVIPWGAGLVGVCRAVGSAVISGWAGVAWGLITLILLINSIILVLVLKYQNQQHKIDSATKNLNVIDLCISGIFSRREILAKMTLGRCVKFSLSPIFTI